MLPDPTTTRRPRVGYVLKMYPRFSETFILTEILALEAQGWPLQIFSLRPPVDGRFHPDLARVTAPVHYLQPGSLRADHLWEALRGYLAEVGPVRPDQLTRLTRLDPREASQALDLARAARSARLDHLHAHFGSVATAVARTAADLAGIGYSFTAHAKDIFHDDVDAAELADRIAAARAVVTVSDYNVDYLNRVSPAAAGRVRRIYNGIDLDRFPYDPATGPDGPPLIAAVGRLVEKKGFDDLVAAAAVLADRGVDFRLALAGAGPLAEPLRRQVDRSGLGDRVSLLGPLPQDRVRELVGGATVFAAPCKVGADGNRDGLPTVLLEAMALGTACVATPVTGIPEVVDHRRTGLLVPPGDVDGLAEALVELLGDRALRRALTTAARARIERDFDARRQAHRLGTMFTELTAPVEVPR